MNILIELTYLFFKIERVFVLRDYLLLLLDLKICFEWGWSMEAKYLKAHDLKANALGRQILLYDSRVKQGFKTKKILNPNSTKLSNFCRESDCCLAVTIVLHNCFLLEYRLIRNSTIFHRICRVCGFVSK